MAKLFQDTRTGGLVEYISKVDKEYAMVRTAAGSITYINVDKLVPYDAKVGRINTVETVPELQVKDDEEKVPEMTIPIEDTRLNLNLATAEQIQKRLPGVGYATAKKIVELRMSLSGERFSNLGQLESIPRVNWDALIAEDLIFIS